MLINFASFVIIFKYPLYEAAFQELMSASTDPSNLDTEG